MRYLPLALLIALVSPVCPAAESPAGPALDPLHAKKMQQGLDVFKATVRPVLIGRCVKCHGGESTEAELDLTTREGLLRGGSDGPAVELGKGKTSRLYRLVAHLDEPAMPEDGAKLNDEAVQAIARWIDLGAPYDKSLLEQEQDPLAWTHKQIDDSAREFWSFQPLAVAEPPAENDPWIRTPIDRFILAGLRQHELRPNAIADRRTLIRRVYFDLIGLPPTPEEVDRFVNDADPQAYEQLIDRLLDSPHFGERWGRHWLDVARFAESHGFEQDYDRPHAYHYRDFVIRALNEDMPFDQFVRWQIAGDEVAPDDPLAMMATGFLGAGVFPTQLTEREFETARYDELDDMAATLGTAMLGLTIGCARCHDHKYDPIPSADYYRLISTFRTTIRSNIELELDPDQTRQALARWQAEHERLVADRTRFEREQLPARFAQWLQGGPKFEQPAEGWITLEPTEYRSEGGATLTLKDDGSVLASGPNPDFDRYTIVAETHTRAIRAIRLETLAHDSFVKGGPGRAGNGNMGLGDFSVTAAPLDGSLPPAKIALTNPRATFEQNAGNLSIAASIDGDPRTGWAVDPQFGKDHAAIFEIAEPVGFESGTRLTFTMQFNVNNQHNIGRPRLSISSAAQPPDLKAPGQEQRLIEVFQALQRAGLAPADGGAGKPPAPIDAERLKPTDREVLLAWYRTTDDQWRELNQRIQEHLAAKPQPKTTTVMVTSEGYPPIPHHADGRGFPHFYQDAYFLRRGDASQKEGIADEGYLQVLMRSGGAEEPAEQRWKVDPPAGAHTSHRRHAMANWITDTEHGAGHLLARVAVNRLWQHHLGRGIVATPNDFGFQGARPTHPELLDWLANRLIAEGWRLKPIHRLILTSAAYMQSADDDSDDAAADPDNQWCWRYTPRRLEAEIIRDSMLAVSGQLDSTMFGPGTLDEGMRRRSIYFMIKRSKLIPMMQLFDAPEPLVSQGDRPSTTIAPQALMFLNSPQVRSYAQAFARRVTAAAAGDEDAVRVAYRMALARDPTPQELEDSRAFLDGQIASYKADGMANPGELALTDVCQVLFSLNEFVFVE